MDQLLAARLRSGSGSVNMPGSRGIAHLLKEINGWTVGVQSGTHHDNETGVIVLYRLQTCHKI